jgi:hypothetical protein
MSKNEKLLEKLRGAPRNFKWRDFVTLMKSRGFSMSCNGTSHHIFTCQICGYRHSAKRQEELKTYAVNQAIEAIDHLCYRQSNEDEYE